MRTVYRVLLSLMAALFALLGLRMALDPVVAAGELGLEALTLAGMSTLRGDLGGLFLGLAAIIGLEPGGATATAACWLLPRCWRRSCSGAW